MVKHKTKFKSCKNAVVRSICIYCNPLDDRLDYTKEHVFHHWVGKRIALIEIVENGFLMEVKYQGNFNFNVV